MTTADSGPLYFLPFDHRHSYVTGMFRFQSPLTPEQHDKVADSKQLIYEGFELAVSQGVPREHAGLLVDEEFGAAILLDAAQKKYITALSTEKSGSDEFEFEYGQDFGLHIERFNPTYAKVLVRYNPEADAAVNARQVQRLRQLSDYCRSSQRLFMFELLVPPTPAQLKNAQEDKQIYDQALRPDLMLRAIEHLQNSGIEPDVWKIEGLDKFQDCERIVKTAQRGGRNHVACIVLGRGADEDKVTHWLSTAAAVPGFIGFAVGRTTFWDAIFDYQSNKTSRQVASGRIAARYREWVNTFEQQRSLSNARATGTTKVTP